MSHQPNEMFFSNFASQWWDVSGPMAGLLAINPLRIAWAHAQILDHFPHYSLLDLSLLDVGCGAGIASEAFSCLGYSVLGIDPLASVIEAAKLHAQPLYTKKSFHLSYESCKLEELIAQQQTFSIVVAFEMLEHVSDLSSLIVNLRKVTKPGGLLLLSTLNRTFRSLILGKIAAEYILGLAPKGAHDWHSFVKPSDLSTLLKKNGFRPAALSGLSYNGLSWRISHDLSINYLMSAYG